MIEDPFRVYSMDQREPAHRPRQAVRDSMLVASLLFAAALVAMAFELAYVTYERARTERGIEQGVKG